MMIARQLRREIAERYQHQVSGIAMSADRIRELNDAFRTTMTGGKVVMTAGVNALASDVKTMVIRRVATFSDFDADNDPHAEHDFGSFSLADRKFFFKVDYYDFEHGIRFGRSGRSVENHPRAHDYARGGVLTLPAARLCGGFYGGFLKRIFTMDPFFPLSRYPRLSLNPPQAGLTYSGFLLQQ